MTSMLSVRVGRDDWPRLIRLAGGTVLLLLGVCCAWQAWLIGTEAGRIGAVRAARDATAHALGAELGAEIGAAQRVLDGIDPQQALVQPALAASQVKTRLPQVEVVDFYSGGLDEVVHADYRRFGYAKAAQLLAAASGDAPVAQVSYRAGPARRLALALPLGPAHAPRAWAWLELPFAPLRQRFMAADPGDGRLELSQDDGRGVMRLLEHGSDMALADPTGVPVPGSRMSVVAAIPDSFIVLPRNLPLAVLAALVGIGGGLYLLWLRLHIGRLLPARRAPPPEPTLAELPPPEPDIPVPVEVHMPTVSRSAPVGISADTAPVEVDASIFRAYDIRGVVGRQLSAPVAQRLGRAIGAAMREQDLRQIVVGRDGRLSGPELAGALCDGLRAAGVDVIDLGAVPTPVVYYAAYRYGTGCGVAVTGSHNPPDYNGFKIVLGGQTLANEAITDLYRRISATDLPDGGAGQWRAVDVLPDYVERIVGDVQAGRRMKVVVDCGNGIPGAVAPKVLEGIGCEVVELYCEVDGHFPNHHPDPSDPHNLVDLIDAVKHTGADLGLAFDGDGDRLGVVTREGEIVYPDRLLMLFARDVLSRQPGATVIYDVKCTGHLREQILDAGGSPLMWRTGHSLIKAKMRETGAELAGEMSGHFFFKERWYGFDDGIYAAARLLEILAGDPQERTPEAIFASCPKGVSTPELKIELAEGEHYRFMEAFRAQAQFDGATLVTLDGVRADWPDGWGLVRASNTTPVLVLRFDADTMAALVRIKQVFREQLLKVDPALRLPF